MPTVPVQREKRKGRDPAVRVLYERKALRRAAEVKGTRSGWEGGACWSRWGMGWADGIWFRGCLSAVTREGRR